MIIELPWAAFKETKDNNTSETVYWKQEASYRSNNSETDTDRYFTWIDVLSTHYECLIEIEPPGSNPSRNDDQADFEDNYKSDGIQVV